jgi:hypothetical protein
MLLPKSTKKRLRKEKNTFADSFRSVLSKMALIMVERGSKRDSDTPVFYRRTAEGNLSMAEGKIRRARTILGAIDRDDPSKELLEDLLEEVVDGANYLSFVAALCVYLLHEEEEEKC